MNFKTIKTISVVCAGNICRSPIGEVVLRKKLSESGLKIVVDSAGTGNWHEGEDANHKSLKVLTDKNYEIKHQAKQFRKEWFAQKDLILVMDFENKRNLEAISPDEHKHKIKLFRSFDKDLSHFTENSSELIVPDPYYEPITAFHEVLEMLEQASDGLVQKIIEAQ